MTMTNFSANIDRLIFAMNGTFGEKVLKPKVVSKSCWNLTFTPWIWCAGEPGSSWQQYGQYHNKHKCHRHRLSWVGRCPSDGDGSIPWLHDPWDATLRTGWNICSTGNLLFNRRTNGLGGDQSVGIVSSTSTRTLAPTISLNWWRQAMLTANQLCQWQIREGKPMTASRFDRKS